MRVLSIKRHRSPAEVVRYAVWLYFRFTLSFRGEAMRVWNEAVAA